MSLLIARRAAALIGALALSACTTFTQTSSGADYVARAEADLARSGGGALSEEFRALAEIEPLLTFPARIGVARIENGALIDVPTEELDRFAAAFDGETRNSFVPVNPFIAALVETPRGEANPRAHVIETLKRAGARQHLDAIFVYEVAGRAEAKGTAASLLDWTIIGAYLAPATRIEAASAASGILFDVRNGYPYGTIVESTSLKDRAPAFLADAEKKGAQSTARIAAVDKLALSAHAMLGTLEADLGRTQ